MNKRKHEDLDGSLITNIKTSFLGFNWMIHEFDKMLATKTVITSEVFSSHDSPHFRWHFSLKLTTDDESEANTLMDRKKYISVYLNCIDSNKTFVKLNLTFYILNNDGVKCYSKSLTEDSPTESQYYGFDKFISLDNLKHSKNIFLPNNTLKFLAEINLISFVSVLENSKQMCKNEEQDSRIVNKDSDLSILYKNPDFSDLTIICEDVRILVHKNILAAKSEIFYKKLKKLEGNELHLPIVTLPVLQELLSFMYTGNCPNLEQHAEELFDAARGCKMPDLKHFIERSLSDSITVDNVSTRLIWAETKEAPILKTNAINFIKQNIDDFLKTDGLQTIIESHPKLTKELFCCILQDYHRDKRHT